MSSSDGAASHSVDTDDTIYQQQPILRTNQMKSPTKNWARPCPMCDRMFYKVGDLKRHMRVHTGEKPFACPYCSHRSALKGNLVRHLAAIHTELPSVMAPFDG